ncbi:MAG: hypothetical protein JKY95_08315 [Planctomycetaceae bacterium]|nr:hypothetical protein [Planctomycetaceae bacterium]
MNELDQKDINCAEGSHCPPVLFLIFNRPDLTEQSFAAIREARPSKLFVAADGPRIGREGENELCEQTRKIATAVDWPCEVKTLFRDENLSCDIAVSEAISWFFKNIEFGIILEDDCLPHVSFFQFCHQMDSFYASDNRVMHVSGNDFLPQEYPRQFDYRFTQLIHSWGWATWRRSWDLFDFDMLLPDGVTDEDIVKNNQMPEGEVRYWIKKISELREGRKDVWDYRWFFCIWKNHGVCICPTANLVENTGYDDRATNTLSGEPLNGTVRGISFPVLCPETTEPDRQADRAVVKRLHLEVGIHKPMSLIRRVKKKLRDFIR